MNLHLDESLAIAETQQLSHIEWLLKLVTYEVTVKQHNLMNAAVKVANFPYHKTLDNFDFSFQEKINETQIRNLASLHFIDKKENIIFIGSSGVGKTHLATALGILAAKNRQSTYFVKCHDLIQNLKRAQLENRLPERIKHYTKYKVLIIDEMGYLPLEPGDANLLFQIVDKRYENKSTIITSNLPFSEWVKVLHDDRVTHAILDRLLHHSTVISILGESYRMKDHVIRNEKNDILTWPKTYILILTFVLSSIAA